jgi:molybdopterin molybdotransferase
MPPAAGDLGFDEALAKVMEHAATLPRPQSETLALLDCADRVLAEAILADRDQPPFDRSTRDGFALRAADSAAPLKVVGQIRAGEQWQGITPRNCN